MNKLKHIILKQWANTILSKWEKDCQKPQKIYDANLKFIQKHSKQKQIKALHNFKDIRKLPLKDYNDYKEIFNHSLEAKINPLNGEQIHFWATSTGSTDVPKIFPISPVVDKSSKKFQKIRVSLMIKHLKIWTGKPELIFVLPGEQQEFKPNLPIGQIGYYFQKQTPKWLEKQFIFSKSLYKNVNDFNQWHIIIALLSDCSGITTSIPSRLTHFLNQINLNRSKLKEIIRNKDYPKKYVPLISKKRINYIIKILENPIVSVKEIWPSLNFISLWKSGDVCEMQFKELTTLYNFKEIKIIDQIYNSSEDIFNFPLINEIGGPLNIYNHLIEFYDSNKNEYLWPWEIKVENTYDLIITNTMGLTRYKIYDKIICTGFFGNTPKIAFHSRSLPEISLGWCIITEKEILSVLKDNNLLDYSTFFFTLNDKGNGLNFVTYNKKIIHFLKLIDNGLKTINKNYEKQIELGNVSQLSLKLITKNSFNTFFLKHPNNKRLFIK